jgi:hypothetical protein
MNPLPQRGKQERPSNYENKTLRIVKASTIAFVALIGSNYAGAVETIPDPT